MKAIGIDIGTTTISGVVVEVDAMNRASCFAVFEHTLGAIAERKNAYAAAADRRLCS